MLNMDYFMESLVSDLSPNASPVHSSSPAKRKTTKSGERQTLQPTGPDIVDEGSLDIYGDILEEERTSTSKGPVQLKTQSPDNRRRKMSYSSPGVSNCTVGDKEQSRNKGNSFSAASNLEDFETLKERIQELTLVSNKLKSQNAMLVANKTQLSKNISCLFMTSRSELQRKDKEIEELRETVRKLKAKSGEEIGSSENKQGPSSILRSKKVDQPSDQSLPIQQTLLALSKGEELKSITPTSSEKLKSLSDVGENYLRKRSNSKNAIDKHKQRDVGKSSRRSRDSSDSSCKGRHTGGSNDHIRTDEKERIPRKYKNEDVDSSSLKERCDSHIVYSGSGRVRASKSYQQEVSDISTVSNISEKNSFKVGILKAGNDTCKKKSEDISKIKRSLPRDVKSKDITSKESRRNSNEYKESTCVKTDYNMVEVDGNVTISHSKPKELVCRNVSSGKPQVCGDSKLDNGVDLRNKEANGSCLKSLVSKSSKDCEKELNRSVGGNEGQSCKASKLITKEKIDCVISNQESKSSSVVEDSCQHKINSSSGKFFISPDNSKTKISPILDNDKPQISNTIKTTDILPVSIISNSVSSISGPEAIASTSCVVSNQESNPAMSPNSSLPFSKMKSPDPRSSKEISSHDNTTTNSQVVTNQTWPFGNREATNTCSESSMSRMEIEKPIISSAKCDNVFETPQPQISDSVRAFPISDLKDASESSSSQLLNPALFTNDEAECESVSGDKTESKSGESKSSSTTISEEATSSISAVGEASSKESTTSKTTDSTSSESTQPSSSSSSNAIVIKKAANFKSPLKSGFAWNSGPLHFEDSTLFTPPKPKYNKQSTPIKLPPTNYDSNALTPSKSDNILCTPNLIVLGDEETTSATIISPFKSSSVPSEFIPPGVRKEIKEINTHIRHIRGKPEYLHTSPGSCGSPEVKSNALSGLLPNNLGFQMIGGVNKKPEGCKADKKSEESVVNIQVESSSSSSIKKTEVDGEDFIESNGTNNDRDGYLGGVKDDAIVTLMNEPSVFDPIIKMAFEKVFRKNVSDFKQEMAKSSCKSNRKSLASHLKCYAHRVKSSPSLFKSSEDGNLPTANVKRIKVIPDMHKPLTESKSEGTVGKRLDLSCVLDSGSQNDFVHEWVRQSSFNVSEASNIKSPHNFLQNTVPTLNKDTSKELSFKGIIPSARERTPHESRSLPKIRQSPELLGRSIPVSPTNSCRVTSSCVEFTEQETRLEKQSSSQTDLRGRESEEVLNSPEPDSTSEPVILQRQKDMKGYDSNSAMNNAGSSNNDQPKSPPVIKKLKQSHSPDSPTKSLPTLPSFSKSASKLPLDFRLYDLRTRTRSDTTCSGEDKFDTSQVESDLFLSSDDNCEDDDAENEKTLNATFVIGKDRSESEIESDLRNEESVQAFSPDKSVQKTVIGGWDEMSLMENHSLSEFDRDVILPPQNPQIGTTRMSSRTTSFSSHVSVGGFSPFSFASPKLTPSHIRSPKDALWSPLNRSSESHDSCHEDVRTPVSLGHCDEEERRGILQSGSDVRIALSTHDNSDDAQLSKLFPFKELQEFGMIKSRYGLVSSDSDGSSSYDSGSDSETDDHPTPVKKGTSLSPVKSPMKNIKRREHSQLKSPLRQSTVHSSLRSPLRQSIVHSSLKSPLRRENKLGNATEVLWSPRVSKILRESFHSIPSSQEQSLVCGRSPQEKIQSLKSPDNAEKSEIRIVLPEENSCLRRSPRKKVYLQDSGKTSGRKSVPKVNNEEFCEESEIIQSSREQIMDGFKYVQESPQKSVRIVDESTSGENIVIGSICDGITTRKSRKTPPSKCAAAKASQYKVKVGGGVKCDAEASKHETQSDANSKDGSLERLPLSLQDSDNIDPQLVSIRDEFVHGRIKVTRRLDLNKTEKIATNSVDQYDGKVSKDCSSELAKQNQTDRESGKDSDQGLETNDTMHENEDVAIFARMTDLGAVSDNGLTDEEAGDIEDGEIIDDEEEEEKESNDKKFRPGGKPASSQSKTSLKETLHITQEGCKVIASPKPLLSRKRGKHFINGKDSRSHGISPMEKVYSSHSLASLSSSSTRINNRRERSNGDKQDISKSPQSPALKRPRIERRKDIDIRDRRTNKCPRSRSPSINERRRRSPDHGREIKVRNRSPRPISSIRNRSPYRNQRRMSPRKRARDELKYSSHNSTRPKRDVRSGSCEGRSCSKRDCILSRDSKNTHHSHSHSSSGHRCDSSHSHGRSRDNDRHFRDKQDHHHSAGLSKKSRSRSKSKDSSPSRGHLHRKLSERSSRSSSKDGESNCHCVSSSSSKDAERSRDRKDKHCSS